MISNVCIVNSNGRYSASMSEFSHFMSWVYRIKKNNDVLAQLREEGICDDVNENEVTFLGFFDLIHVYYMSYYLHA